MTNVFVYVILVHVHISNLAAQTGASLFLQTHAPPYFPELGVPPPQLSFDWIYNKTENVTPEEITANRHITHVIAEIHDRGAAERGNVFEATKFPKNSWIMTAVIPGFERWRLNLDALKVEPMKPWKVCEYVESEKLVILERKGW